MIRNVQVLAIMLGCLCWSYSPARAERGAELYEIARATYYELSDGGDRGSRAENWNSVAEQFAAVQRVAPKSAKADDALYMVGLCRERAYSISSSDREQTTALAAYREVATEYADSNLADDALVRAGRILELQGRPEDARRIYLRVVDEYASSDMAPLARRRLQRVGEETFVQGIRSWSAPAYTRVVIDLDHLAPYQANALAADPDADKSHRIYLDVANARVSPTCGVCTEVEDGLVRQVRAAQNDHQVVRIVLDLTATSEYRVFPLEGPARIVIDVYRSPQQEEEKDLVASLIADHREPVSTQNTALPAAAPPPPKKPLSIVLDPGHGGKDPGAVGPGGLLEKDVVLNVSQQLAVVLRERLRCEVKLTREDDRFLPLEQRTAIANAFGADLFISIHANASRSHKAKGIETYYLDRSSDRAARKMAARENAGSEAGLAEIEHILADVLLSSKISDSKRLAEQVQETLVSSVSREYGAVRDLGVKRGPFYVLTGAMMPAILIETSFITHPVESKRLASATFRRQVAEAMADGVTRFVKGS